MVNQVHNLKLFLRKRIACCIQDTHTPSTHHGQACAQVKHLELRRRHPETAGEKFWIKKASQNCRRNIMSLKKPHTAGETSWWRNPQTAGQINSVGQYPRAISHATAPSFSQCPQWPEWRRRTCRTVPPAELHQDKACPGIPLWENRIFIPNNQNPGQNQSASKTVPELATHWHSRGPQSKLHASSAVLGWGLATTGGIGMAPSHLQYFTARCAMAPSHLQYFTARFAMAPSHLENGFYRQICDSTFSPWKIFLLAKLRWHLLTLNFFSCRFGTAPSHLQIFSPADLAWHLPGLPNAPKNKNDQAKIQIQTEIIETTMKSASPQTKISYSIQNIQILLKNHEMVWKSPETNSKCTATQLYHHKCHNCHKYHKIRQCP